MPENDIAIVAATETIFFGRHEDRLCQWVQVTIDNASDRSVHGEVTIDAGGDSVITPLEIVHGVRDYRCYAPTLWPDRPPVLEAPVRLVAVGPHATSTVSVGTHRPWTVYLLSDACTDYTWAYAREEDNRADDAALTAAEIAVADAKAHDHPANRNHYNFVHAREAEYYLAQYPGEAATLFDHIRRGTITLNPFFTMASTCDMSLEELIRQFYPARTWARDHGLDISYANHQESPTIAWAMATILAGSGITHLVKSILPYECPWAARLEEPPIYLWEGPDGSRVLVRHRNGDYVEGRFVLQGLRTTVLALHEEIIPSYQRRGDGYPYSAIALVGCYGDNAPQHKELPAKKAAAIAAYNAQGWEYPKLVNASHKQFWDDVDAQIAARRIQVPVCRGDYGTSWDAWTSSLAQAFAGWRRAQERAGTADKLAAILSHLDPAWYEAHRAQLARGWMNLIYLSDHAWNGANDANRVLNARQRQRWQEEANRYFDTVITEGLDALSRRIGGEGDGRVLVFNGLAWPRASVVRIAGSDGDVRMAAVSTGRAVPSQVVEEDGQPVLYCEASVPSLGYQVLMARTVAGQSVHESGPWTASGCRLEGPYYAVEVSTVTGGIVSLYDKVRDRELVDATSLYHLNQCLYLSDGVEHMPRRATVEIGPRGPVLARITVRTALKNITLTTTITLYTHLDRVDIRNEVEKRPTDEKQELDFAFPFAVPERQYRIEAPGAFVTPGADQRPGAGQAVAAVRHVVDVFNDQFGVMLSQADSGFVEFGHRTTLEDPRAPDPHNSTVLALALDNTINWREGTRDQAGATRFTFRYSVRGHDGGFDPTAAVRFGWEDNNELLAVSLPDARRGDLPPDTHSFVAVGPDSVIVTSLKPAEEDGVLARLWNCADQDTTATIDASGLGVVSAARPTDMLERDGVAMPVVDGRVAVSALARGLAAARLLFA